MATIVGIRSEQSHNCHAAKRHSRESTAMQLIDVSLPVQLEFAFWRRVLMPSKECAIKILPVQKTTLAEENGTQKLNGQNDNKQLAHGMFEPPNK